MSDPRVGFVVDVQGVTRALTLLTGGLAGMVDPQVTTLVVFSKSQKEHFTLKKNAFGTWVPGEAFVGDASAIKARVFLTTEGAAKGSKSKRSSGHRRTHSSGDSHSSNIPSGRPLTPVEALAAYKQEYPKAKGMSDEAILAYIDAIVSMYNKKKSAGHLKVGKISTIQEACERAGLMSVNKQGQPAPFYQRGGRKNYRSRALEAIFHWVTGLSPKKKHGSSGGSSSSSSSSSSSGSGTSSSGASVSGASGAGSSSSSTGGGAASLSAGSASFASEKQSSASGGNIVKPTKRKASLRVPGLSSSSGADPIAISALSHYKFISQIGVGAFAVVYQAVHLPTGQRVAIKAMQKLSSNMSRMKAEVNVLKTIQHPNVTALSEVIETETHVYLVLEYMQGGELFDAIVSHGGYTESQAAAVTRNILKALVYLHSKGVIHRDLKPENLLLVDSANLVDVKLTDFGMATILKDNCRLTFTKAGTLQYVAPEIICSDSGYSFAVDLWSLGIVVVCLLTGNAPFACRVPEEYRHAIESIATTNGSCLFGPQWRGISRNAQGFVHALLRVRPGDRPTAAQALLHPWLAEDGNGGGDDADADEELGAPRARLMKRPLSRNMERSHTNELRRYSNQRKRGRVRSALFLKQQMAARPESLEIGFQGMDEVPMEFDGGGIEDLEPIGFDILQGPGSPAAAGESASAGSSGLSGGGERMSDSFGLNELEFSESGGMSPDDSVGPSGGVGTGAPASIGTSGDRLSQASLFSVWSGIDFELGPAMQDILGESP